MWNTNSLIQGFELGSPCSFSTMITITLQVPHLLFTKLCLVWHTGLRLFTAPAVIKWSVIWILNRLLKAPAISILIGLVLNWGKCNKCQQYLLFLNGHPLQNWTGFLLLNSKDLASTCGLSVTWLCWVRFEWTLSLAALLVRLRVCWLYSLLMSKTSPSYQKR